MIDAMHSDEQKNRVGNMTPLIEIGSIEKTYDGRNFAVKNVSFSINQGEFLTILGPSGSGKSTLLMMLAGFESITSGEILLDGKSIGDTPPYARDFGVVFQNYALFPHMTIEENIAYPLKVRRFGKSDIAEHVQKAIDIVRLTGLSGRKPAQLSGGQQQRVALARALVFRPRLVLLDEPLGALDRHLREQMQFELKQIHNQMGLTFVYVTHDQEEALTMSDRVAVMRSGVLEQIGDPRTIYDDPNNEFIASFVGQSNKIAANIVAVSDRTALKTHFGSPIRVRRRPEHAVGAECVVCVRPEAISLRRSTEGPLSNNINRNVLSGSVTNLMFVGDHVRTTVITEENLTLVTKSARSGRGDTPLEVGMKIEATWDADNGSGFLTGVPAESRAAQ